MIACVLFPASEIANDSKLVNFGIKDLVVITAGQWSHMSANLFHYSTLAGMELNILT